jgi:hypothetical protein
MRIIPSKSRLSERHQITDLRLLTHICAKERRPTPTVLDHLDGLMATNFVNVRNNDGCAGRREPGRDGPATTGTAPSSDDHYTITIRHSSHRSSCRPQELHLASCSSFFEPVFVAQADENVLCSDPAIRWQFVPTPGSRAWLRPAHGIRDAWPQARMRSSVIVMGHPFSQDLAMRRQIDQAIRRCLQADGAPSASVAIVMDNHLAYANAFGEAVLATHLPASTATRYQLASVSKTFTAQAGLLLVADSTLSLNDPVSRWFPDLTGASQITVRELLNHTSGYPDHYPESYPAGPKGTAVSPDRIINEWGHHQLLFPPGTQFHYSNLEYEIAGRIVENVSGEPLFQFMQEHIFGPLPMTSTIDLDTIPDGSTALATSYVQNALAPLQPAPYEGPGWSFGSGQVVKS